MTSENMSLPKPKGQRLQLGKINTDPATFQPRSIEIDHGHVAELARVARDGRPLDPIRVRVAEDGSYTVLDGHHSFAAYHEAKWQKAIPALVYSCTVAEGQQIALMENTKSRLQMSSTEKRDGAWRLTYEQPELSRSSVAEVCDVGTATVGRMRQTREKLNAADQDFPRSWKAAQMLANGNALKDWSDDEREEWRLAEFAKLKERIARDIAQYSAKHPELVLDVVQEIMGPNRFAMGAEYLGFHEGEVDEYTGEFTLKSRREQDASEGAFWPASACN
jgi:ParB-like chromosome segregation protein Spo0J